MTPPSPSQWWHTAVIYQIYPRSFADSDGDGVGDLAGITTHLAYLSDVLGVDCIWLSPFYPSPQADFGYDVVNHRDVDPIYGSLADFDRLVAEAHRRGLHVLVDYVINHTSDRHPWFVASRSSRHDPKRDWYVWRDPKPDGSPPNNWVSVFGGPAWTFDEATGQYYLHSFLPQQPDLNWRNPQVERAMFDVVRFWLDRGVDGFRIDVAHRAMKDPLLRDNPPATSPAPPEYGLDPEYAAFEHVHDVAHADIHDLFRRLRHLVDTYGDGEERFTIGEIHEFDWDRWASFYGKGLDELHMPYNFSLLPAGPDARRIRAAIDGLEAAIPPGAWPNWVVGNHDEPRVATRWGHAGSRAAAVLLLTLRGVPTMYYGDELGMTDADILPERQQDPVGRRRPGFGRDGCRTPMQWRPGPHAGFSPPDTASTWLPVHDAERVNVAVELADPDSHLSLYRRLLALRRRRGPLRLGDVETLDAPRDVLVYRRTLPGEPDLLVVLGLADTPTRFDHVDAAGRPVLVSTVRSREGRPFDGHLSPWEGVVLG